MKGILLNVCEMLKQGQVGSGSKYGLAIFSGVVTRRHPSFIRPMGQA